MHKQDTKNTSLCVRMDNRDPLYRIKFLMLRDMWKTLL